MESNRVLLDFQNPIQDAISRIEFAPNSNNLLVSSWDSVSVHFRFRNLLKTCVISSMKFWVLFSWTESLLVWCNSSPRLEAPSEAALLDCCFQDESLAFSAGSDGFIRRFGVRISNFWMLKSLDQCYKMKHITMLVYLENMVQIKTLGCCNWNTMPNFKAIISIYPIVLLSIQLIYLEKLFCCDYI